METALPSGFCKNPPITSISRALSRPPLRRNFTINSGYSELPYPKPLECRKFPATMIIRMDSRYDWLTLYDNAEAQYLVNMCDSMIYKRLMKRFEADADKWDSDELVRMDALARLGPGASGSHNYGWAKSAPANDKNGARYHVERKTA